jgi:hypothetical protein
MIAVYPGTDRPRQGAHFHLYDDLDGKTLCGHYLSAYSRAEEERRIGVDWMCVNCRRSRRNNTVFTAGKGRAP